MATKFRISVLIVPVLKPILWQKIAPLATEIPSDVAYFTCEWD